MLPPPPTPRTLITHGLSPPSGINAVALLDSADDDGDVCRCCSSMRLTAPLSLRKPKNVRFGPSDRGASLDNNDDVLSAAFSRSGLLRRSTSTTSAATSSSSAGWTSTPPAALARREKNDDDDTVERGIAVVWKPEQAVEAAAQ